MNLTVTKKMEEAQTIRRGGSSCSQSVVMPFAGQAGISKQMASALSLPFAGGMAKAGLCGALTGAYLVAGLLLGGASEEEAANRAATVKAVKALDAAFLERFGVLTCAELLGCDPATAEGVERVKSLDLKEKVCMPAILACVEALEQMIG